ncbi:GerAB/ArcD/ProY family transporter [Pseudoneobacillus sp. C159]
MLSKVKISASQFAIMVMLNTIGTTILIVPSGLANEAGQDAWIPAVLGVGVGLLVILLYNALGGIYPQLTYVEYSKKILGKWLGTVVSIGFVVFSFIGASTLVWVLGNFLLTQIMPETPTFILHGCFVLVVMMGVRLGLETIARCAEIFLPWVVLFFLLLVLLPIPDLKMENLLPVFESEPKPLIKSTLLFLSVATLPLITFQMIIPNGERSKDMNKAFYWGSLLGGLVLVVITILTLLVLGPGLTARNLYPSFALAKKVGVKGVLERIEVIMAILWFITIYFKTTIYCYASIKGIAQILSLKDERTLTIPFGMLVIALSLIIYPDILYEAKWDIHTWIPYSLTHGLILPIILWSIAKIRWGRRG